LSGPVATPGGDDVVHGPAGDPFRVTRLSVIVPVYYSESTIGRLVDTVVEHLGPRYGSLEIVLVNDGSRDGSHAACRAAAARHPSVVRYYRLSKNFGEHNAVLCGLSHATGEAVAIIDDDFQNPPEEVAALVETLETGYDCVYSFYDDKKHHWFRNLGSHFNDRMATWLLRKPPGLYLSSFKVLSGWLARTVVEQYRGPYPYLDGLVLRSTANIGRRLCRHNAREEGRSNYTLTRLVRLWLNMFTGFSVVPLRAATVLGLGSAAAGLLMAAFFTVSGLVGGVFSHDELPPGWASLIVSITVFAGAQLCVLGLLGEYMGRVFLTQNQSPQWVVRDSVEPPRAGEEDRRG
jgi:undecaprenyl-phosphate 4-deoxy-4-formamido-L-arabinose transferase